MPLAAADAPVWSMQELTLQAAEVKANPWLTTEVTADFRGPNGEAVSVKGFWDGGQAFRIRWTPTAAGTWTYTTRSKDKGLNGKTGSFPCTRPSAGSHGFLRRDANNPYSFIYDDGTHYFLFGNTYYGLVGNALAGEGWRQAVAETRAIGMNKIRFSVSRRDLGASDLQPGQLDLGMYRKLDQVVAQLASTGIIADLIVFQRDQIDKLSLEQASRYLQYAISRYGAYSNVIWCLQNEWEYTKQPKSFWSKLGELASREDPWARRGPFLRGLSIHQQTRYDWQYFGENWYSHAIVQLGVRNRGKAQRGGDEWNLPRGKRELFPYGDDWGNFSITHNWGHEVPVVNDEYGYIGEPQDETDPPNPSGKPVRYTREKHRRTMWGIYSAGGYGSAGDKNQYADGKPYFSANWHQVPEWEDVKHLIDFFTAKEVEYWKMSAHNELVKSGQRVYVLENPGKQYVIYAAAGGEFSLELPSGSFQPLRFDPRTGSDAALPEVKGGAPVRFSLPDQQDWVIYLNPSLGLKAEREP